MKRSAPTSIGGSLGVREPVFTTGNVTVHQGDCVEVMRGMAENSVEAIVTDPPYDLTSNKRGGSGVASVNLDTPYGRARIGTGNGAGGFMGKAWDGTGIAFTVELWTEALRVLKPGGYLLSFGGTRTYHRMTCAIEDAGFEIRDCLVWLYGSGFPKSLDVSKGFDKKAGAEREVVGKMPNPGGTAPRLAMGNGWQEAPDLTAPATDLAKQWQGFGTALKPAHEPIVLARKPLIGTVIQNLERYGTGALNIDGSRIGTAGEVVHAPQSDPAKREGVVGTDLGITNANVEDFRAAQRASIERTNTLGRWPANVLLDEEAAAMLDAASGDSGGASRFFYTAKASRSDRNGGVLHKGDPSTHPTVKPTDLMRYLIKLVTPPGGTVLDPFAGSGSTLIAARSLGIQSIGIEREVEYVRLIEKRCAQEALW